MSAPNDSNRLASAHTVALTRNLLNRLLNHREKRCFGVRLWNGEMLPAETGEAFIFGGFDIEGDMYAVIAWFDSLDQASFSARDLFSLIRISAKLPCRRESRIAGAVSILRATAL